MMSKTNFYNDFETHKEVHIDPCTTRWRFYWGSLGVEDDKY